MSLLTVFLIAIGLSMDSFAVCITQGMCRKRFTPIRASKIALVFGLFQGAMPLVGYLIGSSFKAWITLFDHWFALIILSFIGGKMILESFKKNDNTEEDCMDSCDCQSDAIRWKNVVIMAFATSIDALATGILFVSYPHLILTACILIAVTCFGFSVFGKYIGAYFGDKLSVNVEVIGGIILIGIGVKIFMEHVFLS